MATLNFVHAAATSNQHRRYRDNSSILAYYAYMILGMDYDSMALDGGTAHYLKAQTIVANAQNSGHGMESEPRKSKPLLVGREHAPRFPSRA